MLPLSLVVLGCSIPCLAAITQGSFSVLSYNVAGLPEPLSSGSPSTNTPLISPLLGQFDIVQVQEDFNYHAALYASDNHSFRTSTSGPALFGSGLNTLSNFPFVDLQRIKWKDCFINEADCLTPKGFTFMRVKVADGAWVDIYNLHADAGSQTGDINARKSNLAQLAAFAQTWSVNMPIVIYGDTNSRYTRDNEALHSLLDGLNVQDVWIQVVRNGVEPLPGSPANACPSTFPSGTPQSQMIACETVDKMFIRSSAAVTLTSITITNENDAFLDSAGGPLSDHFPLSSVINWQLSSAIRLADSIGGANNDPFTDLSLAALGSVPRITSITLRGGNRLDSVSVTVQYTNGTTATATHGGQGGLPSTLALQSNEFITQAQICSGSHLSSTSVFFLRVTTNEGHTLSAGKSTSDCQTVTVPTDVGEAGKAWGLVGFWGRSGSEVERLGAIWGASY
ncbi:endonuclease/exonuclease/phosphatase [Pleurotus eryngii]|uniref:Endonuclease/exonuclease/phosphatase n=1 Tax=Pleurotus eryngii TaxID=5323 RepID=A0A9P5ZYH6_PLEER|nr:endonuclease/exonuclease/phosphatase [Pleurotus eryngii]